MILAVDYGLKHCGISISDKTEIIANNLTTVKTEELKRYLEEIILKEKINTIIFGYSFINKNEPNINKEVNIFIKKIEYLNIKIELVEEIYTSSISQKDLGFFGKGLKINEKKNIVHQMSSSLILQDYLNKKCKSIK